MKSIKKINSLFYPWLFVLLIAVPTFYMQSTNKRDFYPFYKWEMFSGVYQWEKYYLIEVGSYNDKVLTKSDGLYKNKKFYMLDSSRDAFDLIQNLVKRLIVHKSINEENFKKELKKLFKAEFKQIKVILFKVRINKVEYAKKGLVRDKAKIASYIL